MNDLNDIQLNELFLGALAYAYFVGVFYLLCVYAPYIEAYLF